MMAIHRPPQITHDNFKVYDQISKADLVEAFRDMFREFGGAGESDDTEWVKDLQHRIENLKRYRLSQPNPFDIKDRMYHQE